MRNKLKRNKTQKEKVHQSKGRAQSGEVKTLALAGRSCFSVRRSPDDDSSSLGAGDIKVAPIFLQRQSHNKSKGSSDVLLQRPVDGLQKPALSSSCTVPSLTERGGFIQSPSSLQRHLEEIETSNPTFPHRAVFSTLQKKTSDRLQGFGPFENSLHPSFLPSHLAEKRKRGDGSSESVSKRPRCCVSAEGGGGGGLHQCRVSTHSVQRSTVLPVTVQPRISLLSRTRRLKQKLVSPAGLENNSDPNSTWTNDTQSDRQSSVICDVLHGGVSCEDVLWTDRYSPQHSSEVIGNSVSINKLHSWLRKWKVRADCEDRRNMEDRKEDDNSLDSWDCGDFQGEAGAEDVIEDPLDNTMLITGPPGVGKTASVYACAQELGFKVFEVNCSTQRSGRHVLSQLKEATQSHLVQTSGKDPLKPSYLNNYSTSSCSFKPETAPGKLGPPKTVISASKKTAARTSGRRRSHKEKANPPGVTLASFFKMKARADRLQSGSLSPCKKPDSEKLNHTSPGRDQTTPRSKKTATSLILFEEVDVIFDSDVGFLNAIKTFMTTTKRPVILTTNDPLFRERFSCSLEEIIFQTPSVAKVCSYLQLLCLAQNVQLELDDVRSLLRHTSGDVRHCILQLQLWAHSSAGRASQSGGLSKEPFHQQRLDSSAAEGGQRLDSSPLKCDTSCTASMLGQPVTLKQLMNLLKHWSETNMNKLMRLLAESWRGGEPLLYNNLELLLPKEGDLMNCSWPQSEPAPSDTDPKLLRLNQNVGLKVSAPSSKSARNISRLSRRKYIAAVSGNTSSSNLTQNPQRTLLLFLNGAPSRIPSSSDNMDQITAQVENYCLDALTDFFGLMSYLDATLPAAAGSSCKFAAFVWTGTQIKDGLLDEMNEQEWGSSWSPERLLDIQAAAEGFGSHRCWQQVSEAWTKAQKYKHKMEVKNWERLVERLACPATSNSQSLRFSFHPLCELSVSQRRYELSRTVLSSKPFSLLGNRRAVCVEYMPVLRSICRFQGAQQQKDKPIRCLNYLRSIDLGLSKSTFQHLAEDFS